MRRGATLGQIEQMLESCGYRREGRFVPLDGVMQGERYFDPLGPLDPEWRHLDSIWALASPEEIAQAEARVRELAREERIAEFLAERDALRRRSGQFTFFMARRTPSPAS